MAYFPNGTAGDILIEQCDNCLHGMNDSVLCPIANVQIFFNYDQIDNEHLSKCLSALVRDDGVCLMRSAMLQAGLTIDTSESEQLDLL